MLTQVAAFALGYAAILAVPGPNVFAIGTLAALRGARAAFPVAIGAALGATALAAITSSAVLAIPDWQEALKIVGAGLLIWVAWRIVRMRPSSTSLQRKPRAGSVEFASGFCTAITNPITATYFTGTFTGLSALVSIERIVPFVGCVSVVSMVFYLGTLRLFSSPIVRSIANEWHTAIRLCAGLLLSSLGIWVMRGVL